MWRHPRIDSIDSYPKYLRSTETFFHQVNRAKMPNKCVVGGCSNAPDLPSGIGLHTIPFFGDEHHEAKKRRKKWVDFVKAKRAKWEPTRTAWFVPNILEYKTLKEGSLTSQAKSQLFRG